MIVREWDGESYCVHRCGRPAVVARPLGMVDAMPVVELVCIDHAHDEEASR